jgi:ribosome biogenesis GTPase A
MAEICDVSTKRQAEYCRRLSTLARKLKECSSSGAQSRFAELLLRIRGRLAGPPRLLLAGEFNSGKSLLANLLIGESIAPTSIVPNSQFPVRFHFAQRPRLGAVMQGRSHRNLAWSQLDHLARLPVERIDVGLPLERLRNFEVMDTPGISSLLWNRERFERQLPLAHLPI